ncbi:MAG: hypothetical protein N2Z74_10565 [Syntrophales bacterium]|nr:hypothetical protein [Syntrophales bacterium]
MAKTYDPNTPVGKVRLYCQETDVTTTRYTDEEIEILIADAGGDLYLAAANLWEVKASHAANKAVRKSIGKLSVDKGVTAEYALQMAKFYREKAGSIPCADVAEIGGTTFQVNEIYKNLHMNG